MALPDKTPPTDKSIEYICVSCWSSFSGDAARTEDSGLVVCPHCGHAQPTVDEVLAPHEPSPSPSEPAEAPASREPEAPAAAPASEEAVEEELLDVGDLLSEDVVEQEPSDDVPVEVEEPVEEPPAPSGPEPWEVAEPDSMTWKMRSAGGIVYNFHGIGAVLTWAASKKNLGNVAISVEGRSEWSDYKEFSALYRKLGNPIAALKAMDQPHGDLQETDDPFADDPMPTFDTGDAAADAREAGDASPPGGAQSAVPKATGKVADAKAPRQVGQRPKTTTKTTKDFIFITDRKSGARGGALWFVLGLLLGLATMFGLWYAGILDQLQIPRL